MPYVRLAGPETLLMPGGTRLVRTREDYVTWLGLMLASRGDQAVAAPSPLELQAHVEHGRWVTYCPCGETLLTRPDWRLACCAGCGAIYDQVLFPLDGDLIARELLRRPQRFSQNWHPGESLGDLARENAEYGVLT